MFYSSTKYDSIFDWVFSFNGFLFIVIISAIIYFVYKHFDKNNNSWKDELEVPSNKASTNLNIAKYDTEFAEEDSFWDELDKKEESVREEEPVPPNAIQPTPYMSNIGDGLEPLESEMEKDCTKNLELEESVLNDIDYKFDEKGE